MELLFEIFFEFLAEVVLQVFLEVLFEIGLHSIAAPFKQKPNPWLAALGYGFFGAIAGALSLWLFPKLFFISRLGSITGLVLIPVLAGSAMAAIGTWRRHRGQALIRLDRFTYGYLFALGMALVRLQFGQ